MAKGRGAWWRRRGGRFALAIVVMLVAVVGALVIAAGVAPAWWESARAGTEGEGEDVENAWIAEATRVRAAAVNAGERYRSDAWTMTLTDVQANAWLAHRLPRWAEAGGGELARAAVGLSPRVAFERDRVLVGARVTGVGVAWAACEPRVEGDGSVWLASRARLGRVALPGAVEGWVVARAPAWLRAALRGESPLSEDGCVALEDGRLVKVTAIRVLDGRLEVDAVTLKR